MTKRLVLFSLFALLSSNVIAGVNVNTASPQEIADALYGVGSKKAQAIYDYCRQHICKKPEDLLNVKGIGPKTLERIREDLIFDVDQNQTREVQS